MRGSYFHIEVVEKRKTLVVFQTKYILMLLFWNSSTIRLIWISCMVGVLALSLSLLYVTYKQSSKARSHKWKTETRAEALPNKCSSIQHLTIRINWIFCSVVHITFMARDQIKIWKWCQCITLHLTVCAPEHFLNCEILGSHHMGITKDSRLLVS